MFTERSSCPDVVRQRETDRSTTVRDTGTGEKEGDMSTETTITDDEARQVQEANASGRTPVVFVHGLWLLPTSWDRWAELFDHAGYTSLTPG